MANLITFPKDFIRRASRESDAYPSRLKTDSPKYTVINTSGKVLFRTNSKAQAEELIRGTRNAVIY